MAKIKLKKKVKITIILIMFIIAMSTISYKLYQEYQWRQTFEFKLLQLEYNSEEVEILIYYLNDEELKQILTKEQNSNIPLLINQEFFVFQNLTRYLAFKERNQNMEVNLIIAMVNVNRDREFYEEPILTNISRGYLMLVNKYHYLDEFYRPDDLVRVSPSFAFANVYLIERAYSAFRDLANEARGDGFTIVIISGHRSFVNQRTIWENLRDVQGITRADEIAARPGHSEHQSGFAIDVADFHDHSDRFGDTEAYQWMRINAHRFGFILRYPSELKHITGYTYEPWHFRYVGIETAERILNKGITFDEYYAFFLAN